MCDSEAAAEASTDTAAAWFRERTGEITEPEPMIARGEVIAAVRPRPASRRPHMIGAM